MTFKRILTAARHLQRWPEVLRCRSASAEWWKLTSCYVGLSPFHPFETRLHHGNRFRLEEFGDLETLWHIYFHGAYALDPNDRVIVDVGANIGLFTCFAAASLPQCRVYSIEPFPPTYTRLEAHVQLNGLTSRVRCFHKALAGAPGHVAMANGSCSQMAHVLQADAPVAKTDSPTVVSEATIAVEAVTLGQFLSGLDEPSVDLLKMDIEGSEYDVLLATSPRDLKPVKRINLEYHLQPGVRKEDIVAHLSKSGFRVTSEHGDDDYGMLHFSRC